ncbi:MAG: hypothetical protein EZS28_039131, partial [Streblomastix strix]
PIALRQNERL